MKRVVLNYLVIAALVVSAAFTSCSKDDDNGGGGNASSVSATVRNASEFSDVVKIYVMATNVNTDRNEKIAECEFKNGKFSVNLPEKLDAKYLSEDEYPEGVTVNPADAKTSYSVEFWGVNAAGNSIAEFSLEGGGANSFTEASYVYSDKAFSISGSGIMDGYNTTFSGNMKQGWNMVYVTYSSTTTGEKVTLTTSPVSGLEWIGYEW